MCVSCFANSHEPVEYRDCKLISNNYDVKISCEMYLTKYAIYGEPGYFGSYNFTSDKDLFSCTERMSIDETKNRVVNAFTGSKVYVEHSVYDKHDVRIRHEYLLIKNFCVDKYKNVIKYVD